MPEVSMLTLLITGVVGLLVIKYTDVLDRVRSMRRKRMMQVGGFTVGLIWGPALISLLTGAFSGLVAISATNLAGLTDIGSTQMFVIGVLFIGLVVAGKSRIRENEMEDD